MSQCGPSAKVLSESQKGSLVAKDLKASLERHVFKGVL